MHRSSENVSKSAPVVPSESRAGLGGAIISGAAGGAVLGSFGGPVGSVVGAVVGAAAIAALDASQHKQDR